MFALGDLVFGLVFGVGPELSHRRCSELHQPRNHLNLNPCCLYFMFTVSVAGLQGFRGLGEQGFQGLPKPQNPKPKPQTQASTSTCIADVDRT